MITNLYRLPFKTIERMQDRDKQRPLSGVQVTANHRHCYITNLHCLLMSHSPQVSPKGWRRGLEEGLKSCLDIKILILHSICESYILYHLQKTLSNVTIYSKYFTYWVLWKVILKSLSIHHNINCQKKSCSVACEGQKLNAEAN